MYVVTIHLFSVDHRLPSLDIVARLGVATPGLGPNLLEAVPALRGVLVLSICNRLILLIDADSWADTDCPAALHPDLHLADASQSVVTSDLGEAITAFLAERAGLPANGLLLTHLVGAAARREMLVVAAGLSLMVVGKAQIVGQIRRVTGVIAAEGTLSSELMRVVECASVTAHRMTHETELPGQGRSVVAASAGQATGHLLPLEDHRAPVVGADSYVGATVTDLCARGLTDIAVYSASNYAEAFTTDHGLCAVPADALSEAMSRVDLMVTCRGTGGPILTVDVVAPVAAERTDSVEGTGHPFVILDLVLTRDVDGVIGALPGVVHLDLARVRDVVLDTEARQMTIARAIAKAKAADFEYTLAGQAMGPPITALHAQMGCAVAEKAARLYPQPARRLTLTVPVVDGRAGTGVSGVDSADAVAGVCPHHYLAADPGFETVSEIDDESMVLLAQVERALHYLAARLLHQPTVMARRAGQEGYEEAYCQALELV